MHSLLACLQSGLSGGQDLSELEVELLLEELLAPVPPSGESLLLPLFAIGGFRVNPSPTPTPSASHPPAAQTPGITRKGNNPLESVYVSGF